jgi:hypothetical protein
MKVTHNIEHVTQTIYRVFSLYVCFVCFVFLIDYALNKITTIGSREKKKYI